MSGSGPIESSSSALIEQALAGDEQALAELFEASRHRLRRMVELRLDSRLRGKVDASDVLQEAFIDLANKLQDFAERGKMSFFLWLRLVTGERLLNIHRRHLSSQKRDARREISLNHNRIPEAPSISLAAQLVGQFTSAGQYAIRAELQIKLQESLNSMDELDREVIALRHFEELTNSEVAEVLDLTKTAASNRYIRALKRLKDVLQELPGFVN